ncbi:MAG: alanine racemase [Clostridia bacterium]|nr:alanine racemase [Clostridia bacterium]
MLNQAVINLNTIRENAKSVKKKLKKGVKFCAVVKADGYGHGAEKVSSAIYSIVDSFAVALVEEGISLRLSGIDKEILVFTPPSKDDVERSVFYRLTHTVTRAEHLKMLIAEGKKQNVTVKVHLKFNTGMNRYGMDKISELKSLINLAKNSSVNICGLYSHFATPENKNSLMCALNKFLLANNFIKGYNNKVTSHVSASGGFLSGVQMDMVRIGILLYGYKPFKSNLVSVKPAMKVYAPVLQKRRLYKGDTALYGDKAVDRDGIFPLIRYGYADGLDRKEIDGLINNRCMDVSLAVSAKVSKRGAIVMDNADILAEKYHTISYEILTKSAIRAEKIYLT